MDFESLIKETDGCKKNLDKLSTKHVSISIMFSMSISYRHLKISIQRIQAKNHLKEVKVTIKYFANL